MNTLQATTILTPGEGEASDSVLVPLAAAEFGRAKLATSPVKSIIEADVKLLQEFGATDRFHASKGIGPRIQSFLQRVAENVSEKSKKLEDYLPMLEFIARRYPTAWLGIAKLHEEDDSEESVASAKAALRRYVEKEPHAVTGWDRLARICRRTEDHMGEAHALAAMSKIPGIDFTIVSNVANRLNMLLFERLLALDSEEKKVLIEDIAHVMSKRMSEAKSVDHSRLGWLYMHLGDFDEASRIAKAGLKLDRSDSHCEKLAARAKRARRRRA